MVDVVAKLLPPSPCFRILPHTLPFAFLFPCVSPADRPFLLKIQAFWPLIDNAKYYQSAKVLSPNRCSLRRVYEYH